MRDPDLVLRAQRAATALERSWERWRVMHGFGADPLPPVSSYVGYSLEEPWGQPRVVFGISADEAEKLAAILDGHDCVGPVHAEVTGRPEWRQQAAQEWRQQPAGSGASLGWPSSGTPLHVPGQQPQPEAERDGTRPAGSARAASGAAGGVPAEEQSSDRNRQPSGGADREPLAELPPFPEERPFGDEAPRFGDEAPVTEQPEFAGEFAAAPVPTDRESDVVPPAQPARGGQTRTHQAAKPAGGQAKTARAGRASSGARASSAGQAPSAGQASSASKASTAGQATTAGQADAPVRRKTSRTSPLQRVRTRRPTATAAGQKKEATAENGAAEQKGGAEASGAAEANGAAIAGAEPAAADSAGSDAAE